jgi:hypothetical protein
MSLSWAIEEILARYVSRGAVSTDILGALFVQVLPSGDEVVSSMYDELERAVYAALD